MNSTAEQAAAPYLERLQTVINPCTGQPLAQLISGGALDSGRLALEFVQGYPGLARTEQQLTAALADLITADKISFSSRQRIRRHQVQAKLQPLSAIKNIIAVGSGKGGVGKSTVSVNLALALQQAGARVGILDADIYGPSQPTMLGVHGKPQINADQHMLPHQAYGLQVMSIGFLVEEDTAMIWRGPMVSQALQQLLSETEWQKLDYLIIDLPPGTGDIQLTLLQKIPLAGAVVVTTPQDVAVMDAAKAIQMFNKLEVPILGIVENMSTHICSACGHIDPLFGAAGGTRLADRANVPLLGQVPLQTAIREACDAGRPTVAAAPDSATAGLYGEIAMRVSGHLSQRPISKHLAGLSLNLQ